MGRHRQTREALASLLDFARVVGSSIASNASSVVLSIAGDGPSDENDTSEVEQLDAETWGDAALLSRPADPTSGGACEALMQRRGDTREVLATKDRRWQSEQTLAKGEVLLRWMGDTGGSGPSVRPTVHLKADGSIVMKGVKLVVQINDIELTGPSPGDAMALASKCNSEINAIKQALDAYAAAVAVPNDGGAFLQNALKTTGGWGAAPHPAASVGSTKVTAS